MRWISLPQGVAAVVRKLRKSGYVVRKEGGVYRGVAQLDNYELAIMEHREFAYLASRSETAAAMFPTPARAELAQRCKQELDQLDAEIGKHRRARKLVQRIDKAQRELEALNAS